MSVAAKQYANSLAPHIRGILERSDLETVTAKKVRKQLVENGYDAERIKDNKESVDKVIEEIYHEVDRASRRNGGDVKPVIKPASKTQSNRNGAASKASAGGKAKASAKVKSAPEGDTDEAFAAALQAELDGLGGQRSARSSTAKSKTKATAKAAAGTKRKSKAEVDDSDAEGGTTTKGKAKKKKRKSTGEPRPMNPNNAFMKELILSDRLSSFMGGQTRLSRPETVKRIWAHIKEKELQDPQDKRYILLDDKLQDLFGIDKLHMFTHLFTPEEVADPSKPPPPRPAPPVKVKADTTRASSTALSDAIVAEEDDAEDDDDDDDDDDDEEDS